ncbi:sulfatase [Aquimarina gracilis]|uniref:Sulfatase n=1 Tax=Aquimarina gracilis TaxID=874422 RepID=A0ABU5ZQM7_9FLAO|nr:sulfatase [Aquimarina gracilis]MEB3344370.1 sulfatase [Aquimarina gracilis]
MKKTCVYISFCFIFLSSCKRDKSISHLSKELPNILWIVSEDNSPWLGCYGDNIATTPNLDKLASEGILFTNAYSNAPVCAPSRNTLITGMYSSGLGTQHMRSTYKIPDGIKFYPQFLKKAGYYTSNNAKKDYNTNDQTEAWDESSKRATYKNRKKGQPFFAIFNLHDSHESRLHRDSIPRNHQPNNVKLYPYHPDTPEMRSDYAVYYDRLQDMDTQVGMILNELDNEGLLENTIVFYYSDHGGPVAGTKRFATQQGLQVPLIVKVPKKFNHLTQYQAGDKVSRPVSFIDFPPTLMKLIGKDIPEQFQGNSFLDPESKKNLAFGFAGRMDERINMVRTVTNGRYRYTRNYLPHKPYGTYIRTLWKSKGMQSWYKAYLDNKTNPTQSSFFKKRPFEELYDIINDPYQLKNLAQEPSLLEAKTKLSDALTNWQIENRDTGFIPEAILQKINDSTLINNYSHSSYSYPIKEIIALAEAAGSLEQDNLNHFIETLKSGHPIKQYWAAIGLQNLKHIAIPAVPEIKQLIFKTKPSVGIVLAEILYGLNEKKYAYEYLLNVLDHEQLMIRVQALNAMETMQDIPEIFIDKFKKLANKTEGVKRPYDARLAIHLLEKYTNEKT